MTLDTILDKMLHAMESQNYWDAEAYAVMAVEYLDAGKPVSQDVILLREHLNVVIQEANRLDREKRNLIETIVNFKG